MATLTVAALTETDSMFTAKERVLLDKDGNCVPDGDAKGVQILAGFKGAQVSEKQLRITGAKGFKKFFEPHPLDPKEEREAAPSKRVAPEPEPTHHKAATVKK